MAFQVPHFNGSLHHNSCKQAISRFDRLTAWRGQRLFSIQYEALSPMIVVKGIGRHLETLREFCKSGLIFHPLNGRSRLFVRRINANQEFDVFLTFGHLFCEPNHVNHVAHIDLPHPHYGAIAD
jgi:hypothetical protein